MKAVIFIDVQNDFITGALKNEAAKEIVPKIIDFASETILDDNIKIYATRDTHNDDYLNTLEGKYLPVAHCFKETKGWEIYDDLNQLLIKSNCIFINKETFGSFELAETIDNDFKNTNLDEIILCGFVSSICVCANAIILRAKFPNTKITVFKNLCAGIAKEDHDAAIKIFKMQQINCI